jgi:small subunit ribosomal protein S2
MSKKTEEKELNVPRDKYLLAGAHIGSTFKNKTMERFIYKTRPDGLAVLNVSELDRRIEFAANMIVNSKSVLVACRKDVGHVPAKKFAELIEANAHIGRFMPGSLTNPSFENFFEPDLTLIVDPINDKQALRESIKMRIPIISICDTVHNTSSIDLVLPCNNKGRKSIALVLWAIAKFVFEKQGKEFTATLEDFGWDDKQ